MRDGVLNSQEVIDFLVKLQEAADQGHHPADIATIFMEFQHAYCFDDLSTASLVTLVHEMRRPTLEKWLDENGNDLESRDGLYIRQTSNREIEDTADTFLDEILVSIPDGEKCPIRSKPFVEGWIRSVIAGSSKPQETAWSYWRHSICPEASEAYNNAISKGLSKKSAMAIFYRESEKQGIRVKPPEKINSIRKDGLVLQSGRIVNWRIASLKLKGDELDLPKHDRARLKHILATKGWGLAFASSL